MSWQNSEELAYQYILRLDPKAIYYGKFNSQSSDIYSEKYGWIEVKDLSHGARCGQFTEKTIQNYNTALKLLECPSEENCKNFVKENYLKKKVNYILEVIDNEITMYLLYDFINTHNFRLQVYNKKSGTSIVPKKDYNKVLNFSSDFIIKDNRVYCTNSNKLKTKLYIDDNEYYINKNSEVRKCSKTKNKTWLVEVI